MVQILCPHCEEEIELDDDASGEFACPHCDGGFEWNMDSDSEGYDEEEAGPIFGLSRNQFALGAAIIGLVLGFLSISIGANTVYGFGDCPEESRIYSEIAYDEMSYYAMNYRTTVWHWRDCLLPAACFLRRVGLSGWVMHRNLL